MNQQRLLPVLPVLGLVVVASACGDVSVTGTFGDRTLNVAGTVYAWLDETEYVEDTAGGTPVLVDRGVDSVVLHVRFTEAVFDPRVDMRSLPAGERQAILDDIARGDQLLVEVRRGSSLRPGDDVRLVADDGTLPPEVLPFISDVTILLGEPVISPTTTYPERALRVGSDVDADLDVTETSPALEGSLAIRAKKKTGEGDGYVEGDVEVSFRGELLPERLAECNFARGDQGVVDPCSGS